MSGWAVDDSERWWVIDAKVRVHGQGGQGDDDDAEEARGSDQEKEEEKDQLIAGCNNFQGNITNTNIKD